MKSKLEIINPLDHKGWDELLLSNQEYSFFHSSSWARVLHESYNFNPLYFARMDSGKLLTLIPLMDVKSNLTKRRGVSLPFSDYCDPIISGDYHFHDVLDYLIEFGKRAQWKYIEFRGGNGFPKSVFFSSYYYGHALDLSQGERHLLAMVNSSTRRNIKRATKEHVEVNICHSLESIKEFYRLHCMTRKRHGLPPQPYKFFKNIYENVIARGLGLVVLASYKGKNIAGAVYFHIGEKAFYKYGASDRRYQRLRANDLVMWTAIKWYSQNGYKSFCFGRTEHDNRGLLQFKAGWGTEKRVIKYYKYDMEKNAFVADSIHRWRPPNKLFNKMPVPLLRMIGSLFYRQMG